MSKLLIFCVTITSAVVLIGQGCVPNTMQNINSETNIIDSFKSCVQANNTVMESYPRQCRTSDGRLFVEEIEEPTEAEKQLEANEQTPTTTQVEIEVNAKEMPRATDTSNSQISQPRVTVEVEEDIQVEQFDDIGFPLNPVEMQKFIYTNGETYYYVDGVWTLSDYVFPYQNNTY